MERRAERCTLQLYHTSLITSLKVLRFSDITLRYDFTILRLVTCFIFGTSRLSLHRLQTALFDCLKHWLQTALFDCLNKTRIL